MPTRSRPRCVPPGFNPAGRRVAPGRAVALGKPARPGPQAGPRQARPAYRLPPYPGAYRPRLGAPAAPVHVR